ncbi:MAG TPA: hypothetical protein VEC11_07665 [Allosphingosinicella sp.]|nr:hypothetical protein [Allosphingosinicella sp.]
MNVQVAILPKVVERIDALLAAQPTDPLDVLHVLADTFGAFSRFKFGTHELTIAGLKITSTAGGYTMVTAWKARAQRIIAEQAR